MLPSLKNIMKTSTIFTLGFLLNIIPAFAGPAVDITGPRTVRVVGEINGSVLKLASQIDSMSKENKKPINILINSPGGSVPAGLQLVEAMHIAQARGVKIRCAVTTLAASMAYVVLSQCNERYALSNSLLLFHPARAMLMFAVLKSDDARYMAEELAAIDSDISDLLQDSMGVVTGEHKAWFDYHFQHETLWPASRLSRVMPNNRWITIVSDIRSDGSLFGGLNSSEDETAVKNFLQNRSAR